MTGRFGKLETHGNLNGTGDTIEGASSLRGEPVRDAAFFHSRALAAMRDGQHEAALQLFTRCLGEDRAKVSAWVGQLQMLLELREELEARLWADKSLELFKGNGELLACKAQASFRVGDAASALAQSDQSLKSPGSSPLRWIARGEVLIPARNNLAAECFARATTEDGADWFVSLTIARVYLRHRRPGPASEHASAATASAPSSAYAWITLGECHETLGGHTRAAECYSHAMQLAPRRRGLSERLDECERRGNGLLRSVWRKLKR